MAYDVSFPDVTRTRNGSLARAIATQLLYAGASQVADSTGPVAEVLAAVMVGLIGSAFRVRSNSPESSGTKSRAAGPAARVATALYLQRPGR